MRLLSAVLFVLTVMLAPAAAWAQDDAWRLERDADGIRVYTRAVPGWSIREIRGVVRIPARLASVVAVLDDLQASSELNPLVAEAVVHERMSETRYISYSTVKMPWPLSDRDIVNEREIRQDPEDYVVTITDVAVRDLLEPRKGYVRIVESRQLWTLTPVANGEVHAEMLLLSDPAGPIPAAVINALSVSTPFNTLTKLREMVQRPEYREVRLGFIREPEA